MGEHNRHAHRESHNQHKATSQNSPPKSGINGSLRLPLSRSPSPPSNHRSKFRKNDWLRDEDDDRPSRKRDDRRHKIHYEDARDRGRGDKKSAHDRKDYSRLKHDHDDIDTRDRKRRRTRSRSPQPTKASPVDGEPQFNNSARSDVEKPLPTPTLPAVSEGLSVEERRRRREAILARHRNVQSPLHTQATSSIASPQSPRGPMDESFPVSRSGITLESPGPATPANVHPPASPSTPGHDPVLGSPVDVHVSNDSELANKQASSGTDEVHDSPSAADYDPSMDMDEERHRRVEQAEKLSEEVPASDYAENIHADQDLLIPKDENDSKKVDGDGIFADDEDDMFASVDPTKQAASKATKAVPLERAKDLDETLLDNWDDPEGYYRIIIGELISGRYLIQASLGKGVFSSVVRAKDNQTGQTVAIKIVRANDTMTKAGAKEIEILEKLIQADPEDKKHCIRLHRSFTHKGHLCMVFENLSINLREVLKKFGRDVGINHKALRSYAKQMFLGLLLLRRCNIIHADLKPDNILANEDRSSIKICDLGSASDAGENDITPYLVSRFYRAPEIILGIAPDFAIDMWSIGCTLFEMYTGKILFAGRSNNQMLRTIMECRGKFSLKILKKGEFSGVHFDETASALLFRSVEKDKITGKDTVRLINFVKPTRDLKTRVFAAAEKNRTEEDVKELNLFVDLLDKCLALNPEKRITPADALKHPFIYRTAPASAKDSGHRLGEKFSSGGFAPVSVTGRR